MLEAKNLLVFFENALALNDFSMTIAKGEIVGVIGSNSAGKTTLMNTLSGLIVDMKIKEERRGGERITVYGKVFFNGEEITNLKPYERARKGIVLARERHPIFRESDVMENLKISAYLRDGRGGRESMAHVFELFPALVNLRKRKAGFLSGGEQQMLSIGMALVLNPVLLLLDEPLLGLSPHMQAMLVGAIKNLKREAGLTILIAEQFARPVLPILERGYVIENGMLTMTGLGSELMGNPEIQAAYFGV
ncbi:MAG: ABC transporter ATP-binding protein [Deltaproteobacteria bacterium HGW-Deltaproteobacteria-21]|nr:MAG: ABC transporter ATP-binding protein [Deltaproteobacteria bacterium HGW-Deltaproteobacteria-21]